jgi:Uma2 family endonuclease
MTTEERFWLTATAASNLLDRIFLMPQHATIRTVGIDEYLAGELNGSIRHEYTNGQLFAMVGASQAHNTIALNIASMLHRHLSDAPCRAFVSDMKVRIQKDKSPWIGNPLPT